MNHPSSSVFPMGEKGVSHFSPYTGREGFKLENSRAIVDSIAHTAQVKLLSTAVEANSCPVLPPMASGEMFCSVLFCFSRAISLQVIIHQCD